MSCADFNRLLEFVEGRLDPDQEELTRRHLQECADCRRLLAGDDDASTGEGHRSLPSPVALGERVGRYVIKGWLGAGGMGIVLRAHDPDLQRDVAVKVIGSSAGSQEDRDRLLREARNAARISHPQVIGVFDVGAEGQRVFIAMELVEGESLARWLAAQRRRVDEILHVFLEAGRGLAAAHEAGIVHGDFKPGNVLVGRSGQVKVSDFGLSRPVAPDVEATRVDREPSASPRARATPATLAGTPKYMAPELWIGARPNPKSDQFSFAVALYEALVDDPSRPDAKDSGGRSGAFGPVLVRAMSAEPGARYASMGALLEALRTAQRPSRRIPAWGWLVPVAALAASLGALFVLPLRSRTPPETMLDRPPPQTRSDGAAEAYRAALVAYHDGASDSAVRLLRRAVTLDPGLAPAHLRLALYGEIPLQERREHVERATQLRTHLSERDQMLLGAAPSAVQATQSAYAEYATKLADAARQFPRDAEIALLEARARARLTLPAPGTPVTQTARQLDPSFAQAHASEAEVAIWQGEWPRATTWLDRCVEASPSATSCMRLRAVVHSFEGDCEAARSQALAMVTADPDDDRAYALLAMTLAATGAPLEAVHEALRTREALLGPEGGAALRLRDEAQLASFAGDFVTAEARLRELEALPDAEVGGMAHEEALELLLLYEQTGQTDEAVAVATKYLERFAGWPHGFYGRARPVALALLRRQGLVSEAQFTSERRGWEREERDKNLPIEQNLAWFDYEARLTRTPDEALAALAVLPDSLPLPRPKGLHWNDDPIYLQHQEGMGRTYLLGGRPRDAREPLELVTRSCLGLGEPWAYVEAYEELGQTLEALGDPAGACRAYAAVLTRWGSARPRSASAEEARKRMAALHCA